MREVAKTMLAVASAIQAEVPKRGRPPDEGMQPESEQVLSHSVLRGTRGYIEKIVVQINGTYEHGWFDACAVMIRRLIETLTIELYEKHGIADRIKNPNGGFLQLGDLVTKTLAETQWNLTRGTKGALPKLKDVGDKSAHSRYYIAHRGDIDKVIPYLRIAVQEIAYLAQLRP